MGRDSHARVRCLETGRGEIGVGDGVGNLSPIKTRSHIKKSRSSPSLRDFRFGRYRVEKAVSKTAAHIEKHRSLGRTRFSNFTHRRLGSYESVTLLTKKYLSPHTITGTRKKHDPFTRIVSFVLNREQTSIQLVDYRWFRFGFGSITVGV